MHIKDYFKNLSSTLSGNFLAMLGCVVFSFATLGAISRLVQGIVNHNIQLIKDIPWLFSGETSLYLPITCLLSIIPFLVLLKFLMKPKYKLKTQITIILCVVTLFISGNFIANDYSMGTSIVFVFAIVFGFPVLIIFFLIFLILFILDIKNKIKIKNNELINNNYYNKIVKFFVLYLIIIESLLAYLFIS